MKYALERLLKKKEFEDISVQEIADDATLNRATFYLHYPDKNALLQAMTESRFRDLIERRDITFSVGACGLTKIVADAECNGAQCSIAVGKGDVAALYQIAEAGFCHSLQQRVLVWIVQVKGGPV